MLKEYDKFFYQSGAMGYGAGWWWHKIVKPFPKFPIVTKTLTMRPKTGRPWSILWVPFFGKSTWNRIRLHNPGIMKWKSKCLELRFVANPDGMILSLHGTDDEIQYMCNLLSDYKLDGIELNYSCPSVKNEKNKVLPKTKFPLYLKLNYKQNPCDYDMERIERVHLNSVPMYGGGVSGKRAQKLNWQFIRDWQKRGINVAGASWTSRNDIYRLVDMGCTHIGIGSQMLTDPKLVRELGAFNNIKRQKK